VEAPEGANLAFNRIVAGQVQNDGDPCCQVAYVIQELLEFLVRPGPEASDGFEAAPPGVRPHVAGV
jgi:hypothetical protein